MHQHAAYDVQNGGLSNVRRASAGFAAGITEALVVVTPFEVVKIKLQQQKGTSKELLRYRVCPLLPPSAILSRTQECSRPTMLDRQDLQCTYLAHHLPLRCTVKSNVPLGGCSGSR